MRTCSSSIACQGSRSECCSMCSVARGWGERRVSPPPARPSRPRAPAPGELFPAAVPPREPNEEGVPPPFSLTALVQGLDPETAALAQAVIARRDPNPRELTEAELAYELDRLTIDLEERSLDERADYIASALAEAEQSADRESIDQLLRESQLMNETRKSLHRRRDQTRLLARPTAGRAQ